MRPRTASLPQEEVRYLESLSIPERDARLKVLHEAGWSLSSLAKAVQSPKTTVHFWVRKAQTGPKALERTIPAPPRSITALVPTPYSPIVRSISPKVPPDLRPRLRELSEMSRRYRSRTPSTSPFAVANEELTKLATSLHDRGVPTADIASAAGVSYRAMARRIEKGRK